MTKYSLKYEIAEPGSLNPIVVESFFRLRREKLGTKSGTETTKEKLKPAFQIFKQDLEKQGLQVLANGSPAMRCSLA